MKLMGIVICILALLLGLSSPANSFATEEQQYQYSHFAYLAESSGNDAFENEKEEVKFDYFSSSSGTTNAFQVSILKSEDQPSRYNSSYASQCVIRAPPPGF